MILLCTGILSILSIPQRINPMMNYEQILVGEIGIRPEGMIEFGSNYILFLMKTQLSLEIK